MAAASNPTRRAGAFGGPVAVLSAALLFAALPFSALPFSGCTFDFDTSEYSYPGEGSGGACATDADCASRGAAPSCQTWVCGSGGACETAILGDGAVCDDDNLCTVETTCTGGVCGGGVSACDDELPCTIDTCEASSGACQHVPDDGLCEGVAVCLTPRCDARRGCILLPAEDGAACDDDNACTEADSCDGGRCEGDAVVCESGASCLVAVCDAETGCGTTPVADGTPCPVPEPCAARAACQEGECVPEGNVCECTADADCDPFQPDDRCLGRYECDVNACVIDPATVVTCPDPPVGSCEAIVCVPATGACVDGLAARGTACDDGDACTEDDACDDAGVCRGVNPCDDGLACTEDLCDGNGGCSNAPLPDGAACDDGDATTSGDFCSGGTCRGWTTTQWRDDGGDTWLDGVSWSRDAFYAIGRGRRGGDDSSFLVRIPAGGAPSRLDGTVVRDGRWRRLNGDFAVGDGGRVAAHENWGWDAAGTLSQAVAASDAPGPDAITGVWAVDGEIGVAGAPLQVVWLSGNRPLEGVDPVIAPWLTRCHAASGGEWTCAWLGDEPAFPDDHGLDAVAVFVAPLDSCTADTGPLCLDPDASLAVATGRSETGLTAPGLYRGRFAGAAESWRDARILEGTDGPFRDLHGSGPGDVWAVGDGGLVAHWNGSGWATALAASAVADWDLSGVWASPDVVLVSGTTIGAESAGGATVLRFAVFVGRPTGAGAGYGWERFDLASVVVCPQGDACPAEARTAGALTDVWAATDETGAPRTIAAVGHLAVPGSDAPRAGLVYLLTID